jgi:isopentenyldiphosphate isomerase
VDQEQLASLKESGKITPWFEMILKRVRWARQRVAVTLGY